MPPYVPLAHLLRTSLARPLLSRPALRFAHTRRTLPDFSLEGKVAVGKRLRTYGLVRFTKQM